MSARYTVTCISAFVDHKHKRRLAQISYKTCDVTQGTAQARKLMQESITDSRGKLEVTKSTKTTKTEVDLASRGKLDVKID